MAVMGFAVHPGALPFVTIRDREKWEPRLANGMIEIRGEGCDMPMQMARVVSMIPIEAAMARAAGYYVPSVYTGKKLIAIWLDAPLKSPG